jgi:hypothetical protein
MSENVGRRGSRLDGLVNAVQQPRTKVRKPNLPQHDHHIDSPFTAFRVAGRRFEGKRRLTVAAAAARQTTATTTAPQQLRAGGSYCVCWTSA